MTINLETALDSDGYFSVTDGTSSYQGYVPQNMEEDVDHVILIDDVKDAN